MKELTQTLYSVADDASLNIIFNEDLIKEYRLIGYDNKLKALTDSLMEVEGGEVGSGYSMMVLMEIKPTLKLMNALRFTNNLPVTTENIAKVKVNYRLPNDTARKFSGYMVPYNYSEFHELPQCFRFASSVAMFGSLLKESVYAKQITWNEAILTANESYDMMDPVQKEFVTIIEKAKKIYSKSRRKRLFN